MSLQAREPWHALKELANKESYQLPEVKAHLVWAMKRGENQRLMSLGFVVQDSYFALGGIKGPWLHFLELHNAEKLQRMSKRRVKKFTIILIPVNTSLITL